MIGAFGMSNRDSHFYAAIAAVVAVHVVLALFVYGPEWRLTAVAWKANKIKVNITFDSVKLIF